MPGAEGSSVSEPARWRPLRMLSLGASISDVASKDSHAERDDLELAQRAAAGDRAAQRALFESLKRPMHAMLYRVFGANRHMEDLLQEAFIELFRSLPSYRGEAKLTTWADRITARVAYRYLRRQRSPLDAATADEAVPPATPEAELEAKEDLRRVYAALSALKAEYRIAFALFAIDGRSLKEVADATGVSLIAAKSRVWRARRLLNDLARSDADLAAYLEGADQIRASR